MSEKVGKAEFQGFFFSEYPLYAELTVYTNSLSKTVFSVKPLFKRFKRFEKPLYGYLTANWY